MRFQSSGFHWRIVVVKNEATDRNTVSGYPFSMFQIRHILEMFTVTTTENIKGFLQTTIIRIKQKGRRVFGNVKMRYLRSFKNFLEIFKNSHYSFGLVYSVSSNQYEDNVPLIALYNGLNDG